MINNVKWDRPFRKLHRLVVFFLQEIDKILLLVFAYYVYTVELITNLSTQRVKQGNTKN